MTAPDPVITPHHEDSPDLDALRHDAIRALATAMYKLAGSPNGDYIPIANQAQRIVDAVLDRNGSPFVVLVSGSEADAQRLATAAGFQDPRFAESVIHTLTQEHHA